MTPMDISTTGGSILLMLASLDYRPTKPRISIFTRAAQYSRVKGPSDERVKSLILGARAITAAAGSPYQANHRLWNDRSPGREGPGPRRRPAASEPLHWDPLDRPWTVSGQINADKD